MTFRFCHCQIDHHSPPLLLIVPTFFVALSLLVSAQQCVRNCSTAFRHSLSAILGISSSPLLLVALSPLDTLIRNSPNNVVVQRKTEWICNSIDKFKQCTENCEENRLKLVEMANVDLWAIVCRTLFDHPKIFSEFISCQRKLLSDVGQRCRRPPNATTESGERPKMLGHFCRQMNAYAKCYRRTAQKCTKNATMVSHQLSEAIGQSFARIHHIARGHLRIPAQCHRSVDILAASKEEKRDDKNRQFQFSTTEENGEEDDDYWMEDDEKRNGKFGGQTAESKKAKNGWKGQRHQMSNTFLTAIILFIVYLMR